jgi:16S rRNA (cytosine1402-N4)-methyltransferase
VLLDLGLSSYQLDEGRRGFAFRMDGPLDMRFDPGRGQPASDLLEELPEAALADLLWRFGEERRARKIAASVVASRGQGPWTTSRLAGAIGSALGRREAALPGELARSFQALRIAVNDELATLERALPQAVELLRPGGRLAVIAFHSLEDRIVKRYIAMEAAPCTCPPEQPICTCSKVARLAPVGRAVKPSSLEVARNSRARSAVLRVAERLP